MKNYYLVLVAAFVYTTTYNKASFQTQTLENNLKTELPPHFKSTFEKEVNTIFEDYNLAGDFIIGLVNEKGLIYSYQLNREILAGKPSTLDNNSPLYIASHSKAFTGTLLKILEEEGVIDLDKSIHFYLPELTLDGKINTKNIKVRQLLNHTHGLHNMAFSWKTSFLGYKNNDELIDGLNKDPRYDPSGKFRYSNNGPILASLIVDKISNKGWKAEMKERIFKPLGMNNTSCNVSDFKFNDIRPSVQLTTEGKVFNKGFYKKDKTMSAAGGTLSSINDLVKWMQFNINHEPLLLKNEDSFEDLHLPTVAQDRDYFTYHRYGYSLGWDLSTYNKDTLLSRLGGYAGYSFHSSIIPGKKMGVIAFSTDARAARLPHLTANLAYNLMDESTDAIEIFYKEKEGFDSSYKRISNEEIPALDSKLKSSKSNDHLLGIYKNKTGWPDIILTKNDNDYIMHWGDLDGPIYKQENEERPFIGDLGPLLRSFAIRKDSLYTGSLKYARVD